jgi:CelD/BcsL family acetyltransferase involved in cellulose biosynthesis
MTLDEPYGVTLADVVCDADLSVRVLRTTAEIESIAAAWDLLLERSACNRAFSSFAWYAAACECYAGISPLVIIAERDGGPVAILPLVVDGTGTARFATRLADYNDIIAPPGEAEACALLLRHALGSAECGGVGLNFLRADSNCIAGLRLLYDEEWIAGWFDERRVGVYIDLTRHEHYLQGRSRAARKDLYRHRRAAERAGASARVLNPGTFPAERFPEVFLALHEERFGARSPLVAGEHRAFVEMVLPRLFESGRTLAIVLEHEGRIVAIDLLHVGPRGLCSWNGGFAASAAWLSPGALIIDAGIQAAIARGCDEYDMLRGTEPYKLSLCNERRHLASIENQKSKIKNWTSH